MTKTPEQPTEIADDALDDVVGGIRATPTPTPTVEIDFGVDLSGVSLHGGGGGAAASMGAEAYAAGTGVAAKDSAGGSSLVAHEVTHVLQGVKKP